MVFIVSKCVGGRQKGENKKGQKQEQACFLDERRETSEGVSNDRKMSVNLGNRKRGKRECRLSGLRVRYTYVSGRAFLCQAGRGSVRKERLELA
jgi:hypothetical protein